MATEHKNPLYFIIEILEDSIIEKTWEKFKIENTKFEQFYDYDINETTKTIRKEPYNGPPESIELRFQDYFLPKLEIRISESSKTLADLHLNEPTKYKKLVKEILDYKERLKEFESDGLQFVDYMYEEYNKKLLHLDGKGFSEFNPANKKRDSKGKELNASKVQKGFKSTDINHAYLVNRIKELHSEGLRPHEAIFKQVAHETGRNWEAIYKIYREFTPKSKDDNLS